MARSCLQCGSDISSKRSDAVYCNRSCKTQASDERRLQDGRAKRRDRARYEAEADHRRDYARSKYWADPEVSRRYSRSYRRDNPDVRLAQDRLRRARMSGAEARRVSAGDIEAILNRQKGCCFYCSASADLTIDHVIPLAKGGRHAIGNLVGACQNCNSQKGAMLLIEWKRFLQREEVT